MELQESSSLPGDGNEYLSNTFYDRNSTVHVGDMVGRRKEVELSAREEDELRSLLGPEQTVDSSNSD